MTDKQVQEIKDIVMVYFGEADLQTQKIIELNIKDLNRLLETKFPNSYKVEERMLFLAEKVGYRMNEKEEVFSKVILQNENDLKTLENDYLISKGISSVY